MSNQSKKNLRQLKSLLENEYGVLLSDNDLSDLADRLSRLALLAKKHKARKLTLRAKDLLSSHS